MLVYIERGVVALGGAKNRENYVLNLGSLLPVACCLLSVVRQQPVPGRVGETQIWSPRVPNPWNLTFNFRFKVKS